MTEQSAWKTDDPEWMAARQEHWKRIWPKIKKCFEVKEDEEELEYYFMHGELTPYWEKQFRKKANARDFDPRRKLCSVVKLPLLFECCLHANPTLETWQQLYDDYRDSLDEQHFKSIINDIADRVNFIYELYYYPKKGTIFDNIDAQMYRFFRPFHAYREDFPGLADKDFERLQRVEYRQTAEMLLCFLLEDKVNPEHVIQHLLDVWESLLPYCIKNKTQEATIVNLEFTAMIAYHRAHSENSKKQLTKQRTAENVISILDKLRPELPEDIVQSIDKGIAFAQDCLAKGKDFSKAIKQQYRGITIGACL